MEKREFSGYLLAATSAFTYSIKGIFAKLLYGAGLDPLTLLAMRFLIALPFFWALLLIYPSPKARLKDVLLIITSGILGLYLAALADFYGLLTVDASLERVIIYTYPAIVLVWSAVFFGQRITARPLLSMAFTYLGLALALDLFGRGLKVDYNGALLIFLSAVIYSLSYIILDVLGKRVSGVRVSAYSATVAAFAYLCTWRFKAAPHGPKVWGLLVLLAFVSTFIPVLTITLAIKRIGASRAAFVSFLGPVSTAILAYFILGESMDAGQLFGMAMVIAGVLVISSRKNAPQL